jgi:hypothetical protein
MIPVARHGAFTVLAVPDSLPRFFGVGRAVAAGTDDGALALLQRPDFDPLRTVVLHDRSDLPAGAPDAVVRPAEVVEETPTMVRLRVERPTPGWLVALQPFYPGWTATVDGRPVDLTRANVGFTALPAPAGRSEVILRYDPLSVRAGLAVSGGAALLVVVLLIALARPPTGVTPG